MNPRLGQAMVALGIVLVAIGVVGLVTDDDGDEVASATSSSSTSSTAALGGGEPDLGGTARATPEERIREFYVAFEEAFQEGDAAFLFDRLHPAVIELYGANQCLDFTSDLPPRTFEIVEIHEPEPWDFGSEREGRELVVEDAIQVDVVQQVEGREIELASHLTVGPDGVRWFTDCGDPV